MATLMDVLIDIASHYQGFTIDYRRFGSGWEKPYRVKIFSSKHENIRIVETGDTLEEVISKILDRIIEEEKLHG